VARILAPMMKQSTTVENYLSNLDSEFFCKGIESFPDRWQHMIASEDQ
jgi:hypothetical protein